MSEENLEPDKADNDILEGCYMWDPIGMTAVKCLPAKKDVPHFAKQHYKYDEYNEYIRYRNMMEKLRTFVLEFMKRDKQPENVLEDKYGSENDSCLAESIPSSIVTDNESSQESFTPTIESKSLHLKECFDQLDRAHKITQLTHAHQTAPNLFDKNVPSSECTSSDESCIAEEVIEPREKIEKFLKKLKKEKKNFQENESKSFKAFASKIMGQSYRLALNKYNEKCLPFYIKEYDNNECGKRVAKYIRRQNFCYRQKMCIKPKANKNPAINRNLKGCIYKSSINHCKEDDPKYEVMYYHKQPWAIYTTKSVGKFSASKTKDHHKFNVLRKIFQKNMSAMSSKIGEIMAPGGNEKKIVKSDVNNLTNGPEMTALKVARLKNETLKEQFNILKRNRKYDNIYSINPTLLFTKKQLNLIKKTTILKKFNLERFKQRTQKTRMKGNKCRATIENYPYSHVSLAVTYINLDNSFNNPSSEGFPLQLKNINHEKNKFYLPCSNISPEISSLIKQYITERPEPSHCLLSEKRKTKSYYKNKIELNVCSSSFPEL